MVYTIAIVLMISGSLLLQTALEKWFGPERRLDSIKILMASICFLESSGVWVLHEDGWGWKSLLLPIVGIAIPLTEVLGRRAGRKAALLCSYHIFAWGTLQQTQMLDTRISRQLRDSYVPAFTRILGQGFEIYLRTDTGSNVGYVIESVAENQNLGLAIKKALEYFRCDKTLVQYGDTTTLEVLKPFASKIHEPTTDEPFLFGFILVELKK